MPEFFTAPLVIEESDFHVHYEDLTPAERIAAYEQTIGHLNRVWVEGKDDRSIIATVVGDRDDEDFNPAILRLLDLDPHSGDIRTRKGRLIEHPGAYACALAFCLTDPPTDDEMRWVVATLVFAYVLEKHPSATVMQKRMAQNIMLALGRWRAIPRVKSAMHAILVEELGPTFADAMRPAHKGPYRHPENWVLVFGEYQHSAVAVVGD